MSVMFRVMGVAVVSLITASCSVVPESISNDEFLAVAKSDLVRAHEGVPPLKGALTLDDAIARAIKFNLDRKVKALEVGLAQQQQGIDRFDMLPRLVAGAGYNTRNNENLSVSRNTSTGVTATDPSISQDRIRTTADLSLSWNIVDFGISYFTAHQNADRTLIMVERRRKAMHIIAQEVISNYWRAAAAQAMRDHLKSINTDANAALLSLKSVETENIRSPSEALKFQRTLLENLRQIEVIEQELLSAKHELALLINIDPGADYRIAIPRNLEPLNLRIAPKQVEESALVNNADLRESVYQARIAATETKKAMIRMIPGVSFVSSLNQDSNSYLTNQHWVDFSARASWSVINSTLTGPALLENAELVKGVVEGKRLALRMAVITQAQIAMSQYGLSHRQLNRANATLDVEKKLERIAAAKQNADIESRVELVAARTSLALAEARRFQAYAQMQMAAGRIRTTMGLDLLDFEDQEEDLQIVRNSVRRVLGNWLIGKPLVKEPVASEMRVEAPQVIEAPAHTEVAVTESVEPVVATETRSFFSFLSRPQEAPVLEARFEDTPVADVPVRLDDARRLKPEPRVKEARAKVPKPVAADEPPMVEDQSFGEK